MWLAITVYGIGAVATLIFHLSLIVGPVNHPLRVLFTVLLWPICLPILWRDGVQHD